MRVQLTYSDGTVVSPRVYTGKPDHLGRKIGNELARFFEQERTADRGEGPNWSPRVTIDVAQRDEA